MCRDRRGVSQRLLEADSSSAGSEPKPETRKLLQEHKKTFTSANSSRWCDDSQWRRRLRRCCSNGLPAGPTVVPCCSSRGEKCQGHQEKVKTSPDCVAWLYLCTIKSHRHRVLMGVTRRQRRRVKGIVYIRKNLQL